MSTLERLSTLVEYQVPAFIREDHPLFVEFLQKYYEFLETPNQPVYELKRFQDNYDIDKTRPEFLKYFKDKILPSFPDESELSTERIVKAARDFYAKKGTPDSFKFIFRALYNVDLEVQFPKLQILKASDGKWILPQAFRLTLSAANQNLNLDLIEKRKAYGNVSRASCVVEGAYRTIDKSTNSEIVEIYVSNVNRLFQNGEYLEINYTDANGVPQLFSEKIIGSLSNVRINPNRRGTRYFTGDPVVINGGLDENSPTKLKAVATVGNVTIGSVDSATVLAPGYGFRIHPNSLVDIISANGFGANIIISSVDTANAVSINYNIDSIIYKANLALNAADYTFDNVALANSTTNIGDALTFETLSLAPISAATVVNGGSFFEEEPAINVLSLFESDYYQNVGFITLAPGTFSTYNPSNSSIRLVGASFSTTNDWYNGWRILCDRHYRTVIDYDGATKTLFLDRNFEVNITTSGILSKTLFLDPRPNVFSMGYIAHVQVLNGGTGYNVADTLTTVGTGYGAVLTPTIVGGVITGVTVTNRGEGFYTAPSITVNTSTGSGAQFRVYLMGDGEDVQFDVVTTDIGQVRDITLSNRGSDYVTTPNVSLKVYDIYVAPLTGPETILENDIVYQGADVNNTTFRATVDSYYPANNILRVFDYSGSITFGQNLVVYKVSTNVNTQIVSITIDGKSYPYKYGDGKARANAEFLNGLIKYNGYYLNTDGQLSSDKKLQDDTKYHNFSYSLISEKSYVDYQKTVLDTLHPAGAKLIPIHVMRENLIVDQRSNINVQTMLSNSNNLITNCNVGFNSTIVSSATGSFDTVANANDIIVINSSNVYRSFAKVITDVTNATSLNIESACIIVGEGRGLVNANLNTLTISGNSNVLSAFITVDDQLRINVNNTVLVKTINSISGSIITLNSNVGITTTNANLVYLVYPKINLVDYEIIRTT